MSARTNADQAQVHGGGPLIDSYLRIARPGNSRWLGHRPRRSGRIPRDRLREPAIVDAEGMRRIEQMIVGQS